MRAAALAAAAALTLTGCGDKPEGMPSPFLPVFGPAAEASAPVPDPDGPGHVFSHRHEANQPGAFDPEDGFNAFTFQWPDGTASWCFTYISAYGNGTSPELECQDVPEGWDG